MATWSLKWRIIVETALLVSITATAAILFDVLGAVLVGIGALLTSIYRADRLTRMFRRMTEGSLRIAGIDRDFRIIPEGPAELNRMARAINRMADQMVLAITKMGQETERLELILKSMVEGVIVVDPAGGVDFANPEAVKILDFTGKFKPGLQITSLTNNFEINDLVSKCMKTRQDAQSMIDLKDTRQYLQAVTVPMQNHEGDPRVLLIISDLTDLRRLETTRKEFVSNASHELRTPLSAIKAAVETLRLKILNDPETRIDFIDRINEDIDRMDVLIQELLELSKLESGDVSMNFQKISLGNFFGKISARFTPIAKEIGISVITPDLGNISPLYGDSDKLERALANLISNALVATNKGGEITLFATESSENVFEISVSDNGHGISDQHLPHIFERFYRIDAARSSGAGTGLGLAIVKHIAQAHDGDVYVESSVGEGSTFTMSIPKTKV